MLRCLSSPLFQKPYTEIKYTLYIVYIDTHLPVSSQTESHAQHNHYYYLYVRDDIQDWDQGQSTTGNLANMTSNLR